MATQATYSHVGISTYNRHTKLRFTNDENRIRLMPTLGHTDVVFITPSIPLNKMEAAHFMKQCDEFQSELFQATIDEYIAKNTPQPARPRGRPRKVVEVVEESSEVVEA